MSHPIPTPMPLGDEESPSTEVPPGAHGVIRGSCGCAKCGLYRWYPPLLLLSTILAGVFCWMYVTKPVFLAPAQSVDPGAIQPAIREFQPGTEGGIEATTVEVARALDPALAGSFGGEPVVEDLAGDRPEGFEPLVVSRGGKRLFQPLNVVEVGRSQPLGGELELSGDADEPVQPDAGIVESSSLAGLLDDPAAHFSIPAIPDLDAGLGTRVARGAVAACFQPREPVSEMESSFMTEFVVSAESGGASAVLPTAEEAAVRWMNELMN